MTSASGMVENVSKSSAQYVHQMAIYMVCNIFLFFPNSPLELTFWITYVQIKCIYMHTEGLEALYLPLSWCPLY